MPLLKHLGVSGDWEEGKTLSPVAGEEKLHKRIMLVALVQFFVAIAGGMENCGLSSTSPVGDVKRAETGCSGCHVKLSNTLPEQHFKDIQESIEYCLICHSYKGPAVVFGWIIHLRHYSKPKFQADCWSCHLIDDSGSFTVINAKDGNASIKESKDVVESMKPYFHSWATSEHLDHRHAQQSVTCRLCHAMFFPEEEAAMEQCINCHGTYEHLAELTGETSPVNPHESHLGELKCNVCHKAHEESVLYCNKCHVYDLEAP